MPSPRAAVFLLVALTGIPAIAGGVEYDVVYVRQPRYGDQTNTIWPEVFHPGRIDPGADLVLLHPDGSEEMLIDCDTCSVTDPYVSFDAQWVFFSMFHDVRPENLNGQRSDLPYDGADIFRINLQTRVIEQLTHGEFTPNTGGGNWDESNPVNPPSEFDRLGYGILNLGPMPLPGGKIAFTSNRNGFLPNKSFTAPCMQLFVMDEDGANVEPIAPMTIGSALHPTVLRDGRLMFSTYEAQGVRDRRLWGIWSIYPDGRKWAPLVSAFHAPQALHFMTQLSDGDIVVTDYYNLNNNGFGTMLRFPVSVPDGTPSFHSAFPSDNPGIWETRSFGLWTWSMPFTPWGMHAITPFTTWTDSAAPVAPDGSMRVGKVTHPSGAPANDLLLVWTPGPANDLNRPEQTPRYDAGLYLLPRGEPAWSHEDLVLIRNDPAYNEAWPRAVVPYSAIYGIDEPAPIEWLPNDGTLHQDLPAGTPFGLVGTSSFYKRESFPGDGDARFDGLDPFNTAENGASTNWTSQGADAGKYDNSDIWAVRIVAQEPSSHFSYGPNHGPSGGNHFFNHANERLRILGEIPLRKEHAPGNPVLDPERNPDTSFLAKVPADTPFTFQTLDRNGMVLNMAQTWHQVRPGEVRNDCGGCHAHSQAPLAFADTAAGQPGYPVVDLTAGTPLVTGDSDADGEPDTRIDPAGVVDVEFYRDIRPILVRSCVACHTQSDPDPPGNLVLDDHSMYSGSLPGDYARLADDQDANWGHPPVIPFGKWRQTNASRYVRTFQSRRSLLIWKIFGQRLDGWTNADHPTELVPGDDATLPAGESPNDADLDFTGTIMPPPGAPVPALSTDEKMLFARWIDLGCPIDVGQATGHANVGWFLDEVRPTVALSTPAPGMYMGRLGRIRFGVADANSGIDFSTLDVRADFGVRGRAPDAALEDLAVAVDDGVFEITLDQPIEWLETSHVTVSVRDFEGNITRVNRRFGVRASQACLADANDNGLVQVDDISLVISRLGTSDADGDVNYDGAVDIADLAFVIFQLGATCD